MGLSGIPVNDNPLSSRPPAGHPSEKKENGAQASGTLFFTFAAASHKQEGPKVTSAA